MPTFRHEIQLGRKSGAVICGVDEAGRGPLAGPVVACAAILPLGGLSTRLLGALDDSKRLSAEVREEIAIKLRVKAIWALGEASVEEIDRFNILQATFMAMRRALQALAEPPDVVLIDGNRAPPQLGCRAETIVGGDARSYSIAAASIFAKVTRDRAMARLATTFPGYGWETNRGYGTEEHLGALQRLGPTPYHRKSFAPVHQLSLDL